MLFLVIGSFFRSRLSLVDENVLRLRVLPNDVDVTRLSSDRYLALMDLGRINIPLRARLFWTLVRNRWIPVARVVTIRYRYPLKMFQRFELRSRVVYWDAEWAWTEHRFERKGRTTAIAMVKVAFMGRDGVVPSPDARRRRVARFTSALGAHCRAAARGGVSCGACRTSRHVALTALTWARSSSSSLSTSVSFSSRRWAQVASSFFSRWRMARVFA